jgi:endoglucanase
MLGVLMAVVATLVANPFEGRRLYVDPHSPAAQQAVAWRETRPQDAAEMDEIATAPQAQWFGDWNADVAQAVDAHVTAAAAQGRWTLLVAYNLPGRDCGGHSGGGTTEYRAWIREFARGIGDRPAAVILEPDALAGLDCLTQQDRDARLALLNDAVSVLQTKAVYLDAGHSAWQPAATMGARLQQAGIQNATGFSLNVSNFRSTADELAYGRALGPRPTTATGDPLADAFLWIKQPGFSDGPCNGGPDAGQWWADYALGLAERSPSR